MPQPAILQWEVSLGEPHGSIDIAGSLETLDGFLAGSPDCPAVFLIWARQGPPHLARTNRLRRRLHRLLAEREQPSRLLHLRSVARRVDYWLTASTLEAALLHHELARRHFPDHYRSLFKLRPPAFVKLVLSNPFPRTQVTRRLAGGRSLYYGPFRTRAAAEEFQSQFLNFFQIRRCQEDLSPSPSHPGCIYGEMGMCLKPCQASVGPEEYHSEVDRVSEFLSTDGRSLVATITMARDRLSEEMNFEEAARQHRRLEQIHQVLRLRGELVRDVRRLNGVAVTASVAPLSVELWFLLAGVWQPPQRFPVAPDGASVSMDQRLRAITASLAPRKVTTEVREDHLTLLSRWYYSSWRDGEWLPFDDLPSIPYRKLVRAISRVA